MSLHPIKCVSYFGYLRAVCTIEYLRKLSLSKLGFDILAFMDQTDFQKNSYGVYGTEIYMTDEINRIIYQNYPH